MWFNSLQLYCSILLLEKKENGHRGLQTVTYSSYFASKIFEKGFFMKNVNICILVLYKNNNCAIVIFGY